MEQNSSASISPMRPPFSADRAGTPKSYSLSVTKIGFLTNNIGATWLSGRQHPTVNRAIAGSNPVVAAKQ
jgi:hypothetical protein